MRLSKPSTLLASAVLAAGMAVTAAPALAAGTVAVTQTDLGADWFTADTRAAGDLQFADVDGRGAALLSTTASNADKVQLLTDRYDGVRLADLTELRYTTYKLPTGGFVAGLPALNLRLDTNGDEVADSYLVYEPYQDQGNAAVLTGEWQTWDAVNDGDAVWWGSGPVAAAGCGQSADCPLDDVLALFPDATITEAPDFPGSLGLNLGSSNPDTSGAVDWLSVGVAGDTTTFDFGPRVWTKEDCKKGGWATNFPGAYKNQGQCVSSFASGR